MGEVYRARDTRLGRTVAIKVLTTQLADRDDLRQRFEVEARAIASLNHASICSLFDIGRESEVDFMVMEYLEGETLAQRLKQGPLPLADALRHGVQIARALEQAHRRGIVHRDLKPANVMLTKAGVKLLDFGLAQLREPSAGLTDDTPTATITRADVILGTPQYMAPEQIQARELDARTDIFAFGSVLYEMITARRAYAGDSVAVLMAAILKDDPPPIPNAPPALNRALQTCWAKDPDERWQSAGDLARELAWIAEAPLESTTPAAAGMRRREMLAWSTAAACGAIGVAAGVRALRSGALKPARYRFTVAPPPHTTFQLFQSPPAISPDGRTLAFVAVSEKEMRIWVQSLDSREAREIADTDGAGQLFWSPDNRSIGFFAKERLKRVPAAGGAVQDLCDTPMGFGGTWNEGGVILFAHGPTGAIYQVSDSGGTPAPATRLEPQKQTAHLFPSFLPGGKRFLYTASGAESRSGGVYLAALGSPEVQPLLPALAKARYASPGYLLYGQETRIMAQRFDAGLQHLEGDAVAIAQNVWGFLGMRAFGVSETGVLVYAEEEPPVSQLTWFERSGKRRGTVGPAGPFIQMELARDQRRVLLERYEGGYGELWILDLVRGVLSRLTSGPSWSFMGRWSADGSKAVYSLSAGQSSGIYQKDAGGGGQEQLILSHNGGPQGPTDCSVDGRYVVYAGFSPKLISQLWLLPLTGGGKPAVLLPGPFNSSHGRVSPDGRWLAYVSNESGAKEVYVCAFPQPAARVRVSTGGGIQPQWRADSKELFYIAPADRSLMAVPVKAAAEFQPGTPVALFQAPFLGYFEFGRNDYGVAPDGQSFLVNARAGAQPTTNLVVVAGWQPAP
jgi:Tol biopolymer transport system component/predicted Ser/Thr protein kinase